MTRFNQFAFVFFLAISACHPSKKTNLTNPELTETYWKLTELMGKPVAMTPADKREMHMILKNENSRIQGHAGCNSFTGSYELKEGNRIVFSKMAVTQMACIDMETEDQFLKVLETADNYNINGNILQLNRARMAPLAKFEAVWLR